VIPLLAAAMLVAAQSATPAALIPSSYVPQRVFDTRQNAFTDFESMLADLARADVVFVGEQHDDPNTHRLELAILEGLVRRHTPVVLGMEMFERDVQPLLDQYASGTVSEEAFLAGSRPWPRYGTDYRPLVEWARAQHLPIVASDVPRSIAADVSKSGMAVVDALGADRRLAARALECPTSGDYYDRFVGMMDGHPAPTDAAAPTSTDAARTRNDRFYFAQCLKDETMGESVADAFQQNAGRRATIVHVNGAFHSDFGEGAAASARRRLSGRRVAVVSILPVGDIDAAHPDATDLKRADFLIYTLSSKQ
jgi:uncharacterized iron-regulated protein